MPGEPRRPLPTSLAPLLAWARRVKLLPGRRSRAVDQSLVKLRNWAAHPDDYSFDYPPSVARGLCQIAEYINMLWGHPSPDGRTFKTRVHRRLRVVGISPTGPRPDPYAVGSALFLAVVELAGERVDHTALTAEIARISGELQALPRP